MQYHTDLQRHHTAACNLYKDLIHSRKSQHNLKFQSSQLCAASQVSVHKHLMELIIVFCFTFLPQMMPYTVAEGVQTTLIYTKAVWASESIFHGIYHVCCCSQRFYLIQFNKKSRIKKYIKKTVSWSSTKF